MGIKVKNRFFILLSSELLQLRSRKFSVYTPFVFALVILLIQQMLWTDLSRELLVRVFICEVFTATILSVYLGLLSSFDAESEDGVFDSLRIWPFGLTDIFAAKVCSNWIKSISLIVGVSAAGLLFSQYEIASIGAFLDFLIVLGASSLGMVAIGCLLVLATLSSKSRANFLHLMFFPLILPVLIGGVECARQILEFNSSLSSLLTNWLGFVIIFDLLYLVLGALLAQETQGSVG